MACPSDNSYLNDLSKPIERLKQIDSANIQAQIALAELEMCHDLIKVFEIINSTRGLCARIAMQAGFNSADETALGGKILMLGGLALGASGVVQGVGNFEQAKEVAEATEIRNAKLAALDEEFKAKDLDQNITLEVKTIDEPCSHMSNIDDKAALDIEEDILYDAQENLSSKRDKIEDVKQKSVNQKNRVFGDLEKNKRIKLINKDYEIRTDSSKAEASKLQAAGTPGQAAYNIAQGMSNVEKSRSDKESLIQQVQQDNQNQQANTAEGIKKEIDKLAEFNPFQRNSSSQRG